MPVKAAAFEAAVSANSTTQAEKGFYHDARLVALDNCRRILTLFFVAHDVSREHVG
jgi:hypothetical protein